MNNKITTAAHILALVIGSLALSACNNTRDGAHQLSLKPASQSETSYEQQRQLRRAEENLIAELRIDTHNVDALFQLAKLREHNGKVRLARNGYRQVVEATVPATEKNEQMKAYAATRLAVLRADLVKISQGHNGQYRF